ncbi:hypothetical protein J6590_000680 [Homalodisca vitripennis]|nr:hypothetical protein J6590_000680 [Homalodisca vitripennis]
MENRNGRPPVAPPPQMDIVIRLYMQSLEGKGCDKINIVWRWGGFVLRRYGS